jgi:hypothetical protein
VYSDILRAPKVQTMSSAKKNGDTLQHFHQRIWQHRRNRLIDSVQLRQDGRESSKFSSSSKNRRQRCHDNNDREGWHIDLSQGLGQRAAPAKSWAMCRLAALAGSDGRHQGEQHEQDTGVSYGSDPLRLG